MFRVGLPVLLISAGVIAVCALATPRAEAARSVRLSESGHLHRTSASGQQLNGQGTFTGTVHGTVYIHLWVGSGRTFTAEVNVYARKGSLSGHGTGSYHLSGGFVQFSGRFSITRGTGRYRHARARGVSFTGSVQLLNDVVTVRLSGVLRY